MKKNFKKLYHITAIENISSILKNGLKANEDGEIFLFEDKSIGYKNVINNVSDCIAKNQIFLDEYAMFEIDINGIDGELLHDDVAEFSARFQYIVKQPVIKPEFINLFGAYKTEYTNLF